MARNEKTSKAVGKLASQELKRAKSRIVRALAGSALTQRPDHKKKKK